MRAWPAVAFLALVVALPASAADTLHIHGSHAGSGWLAPTPVPDGVSLDLPLSMGLLSGEHTMVIPLSTDPVEYEVQPDGEQFVSGGSYGLAYPAMLAAAAAHLEWYLSSDEQVIPIDVRVEARLTTGEDGDVLASGTHAQTLEPAAAVATVDSRLVHHFPVVMDLQTDHIRVEGLLQLEVAVVRTGPVGDLSFHSSPDLRPSLQLDIANPFRFEYVHPQWLANGTALVHVATQTPWGAHGIASVIATMTFEGQTRDAAHIPPNPVAHCHCPPAARSDTFVVEGAPAGDMSWNVIATMPDGSVHHATAAFAAESKDAPGPGPAAILPLLLALAGVLLMTRRAAS